MKNAEKTTAAPERASPMALFTPVAGFNDAVLVDAQRQEMPPAEMPYTYKSDDGLASRRSKHMVRTHAEVEACQIGTPDPSLGLSMRAALPAQCENDLFPFQTDRFGKQRK